MSILVTYGSRRGGTEGLAAMVADGLRERGYRVDLVPAARVEGRLDGYEAVVVGGSVYHGRWNPDARHFVRHHMEVLHRRPTYLFSSGPLDTSAATGDVPPVRSVRRLMKGINARGHITFGGRLEAHPGGLQASVKARRSSGDWRNPGHVDAWVDGIVADLHRPAARAGVG